MSILTLEGVVLTFVGRHFDLKGVWPNCISGGIFCR